MIIYNNLTKAIKLRKLTYHKIEMNHSIPFDK